MDLFCVLDTQWRVVAGLGGLAFVGLDYAAVDAVFRMRRVPSRERGALLEDLRVMEHEALPHMNRGRDG